jgi:hypothetical protein
MSKDDGLPVNARKSLEWQPLADNTGTITVDLARDSHGMQSSSSNMKGSVTEIS